MYRHIFAHEVQPYSGACLAVAPFGVPALVVPLEYKLLLVVGYAASVVGYRYAQFVACGIDVQVYIAASRSELDGVREQVGYYFIELVLVKFHVESWYRGVKAQGDLLAFGLGYERVGDIADESYDIACGSGVLQ